MECWKLVWIWLCCSWLVYVAHSAYDGFMGGSAVLGRPFIFISATAEKYCIHIFFKKNWYTVCVESVDRVVVGVFRGESGQCHVPDTCVICGASKPWDKCKYVVFTYMIHRRVKSVFFVSSVALWGVRQCNVRKTLSPHKCFAFTSV